MMPSVRPCGLLNVSTPPLETLPRRHCEIHPHQDRDGSRDADRCGDARRWHVQQRRCRQFVDARNFDRARGVARGALPIRSRLPDREHPEQQAEWAALVATPESRAQLVADLKESFAGVAEVHVETGGTAGRFGAMPDLAYGYNGHVWMTLSYADAANGLISTAVWYCSTKIPGWICNSLGNVLRWLVSGWGWANNHGVWGAAYWSGYVTGGRW